MANKALDNTKVNKLPRQYAYHGKHAFATTETTATISLPFKTQIEAVLLSYTGTVAVADGPLSWAWANGALTISRVAGTTSAAAFSFLVIGY